MIYYGHVRLTGDVDFFYGLAESNLKLLFAALLGSGMGTSLGCKAMEISRTQGEIIQPGIPPNRIDRITEVDGVEFRIFWS